MNDRAARGFELARRIESEGFEAVLVGGAVRDILLGREVGDLDIATSARHEELASLFPKGRAVGPEGKRVFLVPCEGGSCEVVSYAGSLEGELARRDFTVNALAMRATGEIVRAGSGLDDIRDRLLRFNGSPPDRLREDPLRALRLPRFAAELHGFTVDPGSRDFVRAVRPPVEQCAPERIGREMRLGLSGDAPIFVRTLDDCGLAGLLEPLVGVRASPAVIVRALERLDTGAEPLVRRAAALALFRGWADSPGREGEGVRTVLARWGWPSAVVARVTLLVRKRSAFGRGDARREAVSLLLDHGWEFCLSLASVLEEVLGSDRAALLRATAASLLPRMATLKERIPSGDELMEHLSLREGPLVGRILRELSEEHLLRDFPSRERALKAAELLAKDHKEG
ncbi:MAG: CCA tRNA nucleotidyltransferase [Synergistaceae bacterium]|nr:hypothetical protein [Synergistota bacterium]NLM70340.1 CCA tRNA nucleotidyltransferase [Synergistaceae bacterium]